MVRRSVRALLLATSLGVFAASAALWARGYFREDRVEWMSTEDVPGRLTYRVWQFTSFRGSFSWEWETLSITDDTVIVPTRRNMAVVPAFQYFPAPGRLSPWYSVASDRSPLESLWFDGSGFVPGGKPPVSGTSAYVAVPLWAPMLLGIALPAWRVWKHKRNQRRRRIADRICVRCGYDLRYSEGRCPECGGAIAAGTAGPTGAPTGGSP